MKIALFEVDDWEQECFRGLEDEHEVHYSAEPLNAESAEKYADCEVISTFIYSSLDNPALDKLSNLQFIAIRSTGFDNIAIETCKERDIKVANVPSYGKSTVAEHVFALLSTISHNMVEAVERTRQGNFSQQGLQGFDLAGRTLGIIGTGEIGQYVAKIANGFGMKVLAFDVSPKVGLDRELGFAYVDMDVLLERSDIVTLHVPGGEATRNLLSHEQFAKMKTGAVLINTARGSIIDIDALMHALADGKLAATGLDVLPEEPVIREEAELLRSYFEKRHNLDTLLANHLLLNMRNVVITPHSAFNTREAVQRILDTTRENIDGFIGGEFRNLVVG